MKLKLITAGIINLFLALPAKAALVPCGPGFPPPDDKCQLCHIFTLLDNIFDFVLFSIVPPIALIAVVIAGIYFFTSAGNPQSIGKAKQIFFSVVMGMVIIYGAYLLINGFMATIGIAEGDFGTNIKNWFEYPCTY